MDMLMDSVIYDPEIMVKSEASSSSSSSSSDIGMSAAPKHMLIPSDMNYYYSSTSSGESSGCFHPQVASSSSHHGATQMMHATGGPLDMYRPFPCEQDQEEEEEDTLGINFDIDLEDAQDAQELAHPSPTTILFFEMMQDFPDLSAFVCHPDFSGFARIWLDYQRHIHMAQHPEQRPAVSAWLKTAALQLHFCLVTLVRSSPERNQEAASMFSAFRRLKDRVEIMHSVISIVETGRLAGQSPLEAIAPLMAQADEIKRNVDYFAQEENVIPVLNEHTNLVELRDPNQVSMSHLSRDLVSTYNMMPYDTDASALDTGANSPMDPAAAAIHAISYQAYQEVQAPFLALDNALVPTAAPGFTDLTSLQPDVTDLSASVTPVFYVPSQQSTAAAAAITTGHSTNRFGFETPLTQDSTESTPLVQPLLFSHIEPSWIHSPQANYWHSLPVTPSVEHTTHNFLSYPGSPTCTHPGVVVAQDTTNEEKAKQEEAHTICTIQAPYNTSEELSPFSPTCGSLTTVSPINTLSDDDEEEEQQAQEQDGSFDGDLAQEDDCPTPDTDDDDYSQLSEMEDDDDEWIEPRPSKKQQPTTSTAPITAAASTPATGRRNRKSGPNTKDLRNTRAAATHTTGSQKARRTATSYDAKTTHYLKSIFFDIYSTKDKLTKDQRRKVQQETGLKPRNITYWFSNHKRRFQHSLNIFKKTVQETQGQVKTYDDFLIYRRLHGLPEEVQDTEFLDDDKSIDF